jgi:hypothetical protein
MPCLLRLTVKKISFAKDQGQLLKINLITSFFFFFKINGNKNFFCKGSGTTFENKFNKIIFLFL